MNTNNIKKILILILNIKIPITPFYITIYLNLFIYSIVSSVCARIDICAAAGGDCGQTGYASVLYLLVSLL